MNTRLAVATHILTYIETNDGKPATSDEIADSVNTNPTLVRRLLSQLSKAGLTRSQMGTGGGALLTRPASTISMLDIYLAIDEGDVFGLHEAPNPNCPLGRSINGVLKARIGEAEAAMREALARTSVADVAGAVEK